MYSIFHSTFLSWFWSKFVPLWRLHARELKAIQIRYFMWGCQKMEHSFPENFIHAGAQVRMLANRRCNNGTSVHYVDNEALHTAQHTLQNEMPYFGLYSELHLSEQLFTAVFGGYFSGVEQHNTSLTRYRSYQGSHAHDKTDFSQEMLAHLPFELIRKLQRNNLYDIELYKFAHALFSERLRSNGFA